MKMHTSLYLRLLGVLLAGLPFCLGAQTLSLSGTITGVNDSTVCDVTIELTNEQGETLAETVTDDRGHYQFDQLAPGATYGLRLDYASDDLNGVSTFDIVLASLKLVGRMEWTRNWQEWASDVDGSGTLNIRDLLLIRRRILFLPLPPDADFRWAFQERGQGEPANEFEILLQQSITDYHFRIVHKGDLNGSPKFLCE